MTDGFNRPFVAIRREGEGGDFERTMAEYLVNPLDQELRNVRTSTSATSSDVEDGVTTGTAPDALHAVVAPNTAIRIGMTTRDEYHEMSVGWRLTYETTSCETQSGARRRGRRRFWAVPLLSEVACAVSRSALARKEVPMRTSVLTPLVLCGVLLLGAPVGAQLAPVAPPSPPAQMPFDVPYGTPIGLTAAKAAIAAAEAEARRHNWKMNISVVDPNGDLIAFERMDGAQLASIQISQHKARTAARYRRETITLEQGVQAGNVYLLTLDDVIASRGGFPLITGGHIIGAIGCSGGTGSQDAATCKAGADTVK